MGSIPEDLAQEVKRKVCVVQAKEDLPLRFHSFAESDPREPTTNCVLTSTYRQLGYLLFPSFGLSRNASFEVTAAHISLCKRHVTSKKTAAKETMEDKVP